MKISEQLGGSKTVCNSYLGPILVCLVLRLPGQLVTLDLVHAVEDQLHQWLRLLNSLFQSPVLGQQVEDENKDLHQ